MILVAILRIGPVLGSQPILAQQGPNPRGKAVLGEGEFVIEYGRSVPKDGTSCP